MTTVRLGDICEQARESVRPGQRHDLRYIGLESIESGSGRFVEGELSKTPETPSANSFRFGPEHVLYGKLRPYLNKVALPDFEGKCSTEIIPLLPSNRVDRSYLSYFLRSKKTVDMISARTAGARMPRAEMDFVLSLSIPLPALDEQRRIVDILSRAESIVRLRREAQQKAAELVPAIFLDMFGDPTINRKGWKLAALSDLCDKCLLTDPSKLPHTEFTYIDIASIDNVHGQIVKPKKIIGSDAPSRARQVVQADDVIVSTVRPNLKGSAFVPENLAGQICSTGFCVLRPKAQVSASFIYALVRSDWFVDQLMTKVRGAQYPAVSDKDIFGLKIPVPSHNLQLQFEEQFSRVQAIQSQQNLALKRAEDAFSVLLDGSFAK